MATFGSPGRLWTALPSGGAATCASLRCEALKLWPLCRARCQTPGRAPRTTSSKSSVNSKGGRSRRQSGKGGMKRPLEAPPSNKKVKQL